MTSESRWGIVVMVKRVKIKPTVDPTQTIQEIFQRYPQVIPVFLEFKLDCVGCSLEAFCTLEDVFREYTVDRQAFMTRLEKSLLPGGDRHIPQDRP